ncbi:MAG: LD-carboxypeptidase [Desulfamplus sp.]|nr:LD-carboxypeptidase [Desulfamplus sp.]
MNNYKTPQPIKTGDTLGVCAPSGSFDNDRFNIGINRLKSMGFNIYIPSDIYEKKRYLAGEDKLRADVINSLFEMSDIKAIICARGGFGAMRILNYIDYDLIAKNPKLFVGFSDITALLVTISERAMMKVVHGPVVTSLADTNEATLQSLYEQLTSSYDLDAAFSGHNSETRELSLSACCNWLSLNAEKTLRKGVASGKLTGGNLTTLCHLIGTKFQPNFDGSILFLEDLGEPPYKIDRMLTQMNLAGMLSEVKGVIVGSFEGYGHQEFLDEIILEIFDNPNIPIVVGVDAGHGKTNISMRFATMVQINGDKKTINWLL